MLAQSLINLFCQKVGFIRHCSSSARLVWSLCWYFCISPPQLLILSEVARTFLQHLLILFATASLCVDAHALAFEPHLAVHPFLLAKVIL